MVIKIEDREIELHFGIRFVRELDKKYYVENANGVRFGMGVETAVPLLLANDIVTLAEVIWTATYEEKKRPTAAQVDKYVDNVEDIDALYDEVMAELGKQNATKRKVEMMVAEMKRQTQKLKA